MAVFSWIVVGALVGYVTGLIFGRIEGREVLRNVVAGIVGAVLGGLVVAAVGNWEIRSFDWTTYLAAAAGATVTVLLLTFIRKK